METLFNPDNPLDFIKTPTHRDDPITSKQAAASLPIKKGKERYRLLVAFSLYGAMTDQEAGEKAQVLGEYDDRRHCSLLRKYKLIERTGETRPTKRGNPAMVCRITDKGLEIVETVSKEKE